jgi:hypothetical protein
VDVLITSPEIFCIIKAFSLFFLLHNFNPFGFLLSKIPYTLFSVVISSSRQSQLFKTEVADEHSSGIPLVRRSRDSSTRVHPLGGASSSGQLPHRVLMRSQRGLD